MLQPANNGQKTSIIPSTVPPPSVIRVRFHFIITEPVLMLMRFSGPEYVHRTDILLGTS